MKAAEAVRSLMLRRLSTAMDLADGLEFADAQDILPQLAALIDNKDGPEDGSDEGT